VDTLLHACPTNAYVEVPSSASPRRRILSDSEQQPSPRAFLVTKFSDLDAERTFAMVMSLPALLVLLIIAAICGAIGRALAGGGGGLLTSIVIGFVGALIGPLIAHQLKLSEPLMVHVNGEPFPIVWSIIGAALFVAFLHLLSRRRMLT
jgi:uncharacterized membrane protein YeaQ/YmgE (transglycosylase-associated protein family)